MLYDLTINHLKVRQMRLDKEDADSLNRNLTLGVELKLASIKQRFKPGDPVKLDGAYFGIFVSYVDDKYMRVLNKEDLLLKLEIEGVQPAEYPDRLIDAAGNYLGIDIGDWQIYGYTGRMNRRASDVAVPYNLFAVPVTKRGVMLDVARTYRHMSMATDGGDLMLHTCKCVVEGGRLKEIQLPD